MRSMKRCLVARSRCVLAAPAFAQGKLNVITTTEDLASIAREVGGDRITVESIARGLSGSALRRGEAELHPEAAEGRPADRRRPRAGDRLAAAAHSAEPQREDPAGRRRAISTRRCTAQILEIPTGPDHARDGRRPPARQPALLAGSGERQAHRARRSPTSCRSSGRTTARTSTQRLADFTTRLDAAEKRWLATMAPYKGTKVVTYHRSFPNFAERFGLEHHRLRRAAAGHSADAAAHARSDQRDEAAERQARPGRAVLRSEDAERDRPRRPARRCW